MNKKPFLVAVDDEPINRYVLEDLLEEQFEIKLFETGHDCLAFVRHTQPDLILLDVAMPGMDGYEVCRALKAIPETAEIPVIFLTARVEVLDEKKGFDLGAVDYIAKPFSEAILLARIRTHLSLSESKKRQAEQNSILHKERSYIENIIMNMRNKDIVESDHLSYCMTPLSRTNGDLILSAKKETPGFHYLIGDFTGHGLPAAIGGPLVSALFHFLTEQSRPMEEIIYRLNEELVNKMPAELFMAATFIDWMPDKGVVRIWNLGMPELFTFRNNRLSNRVPSSNLPLGIVEYPDPLVPSAELEVEKQDRLFAYSDGVIEARSTEGELYGKQRLQILLQQMLQDEATLDCIYGALEKFSGQVQLKDDVTILQIQL